MTFGTFHDEPGHVQGRAALEMELLHQKQWCLHLRPQNSPVHNFKGEKYYQMPGIVAGYHLTTWLGYLLMIVGRTQCLNR